MGLKAVLFDMDGTIWENPVDWAEVRAELGLGLDGLPIFQHLRRLTPEERRRGEDLLRAYEARGVEAGRPAPGAGELIEFLRQSGLVCALVTNNSRESALGVLRRHPLPFDQVFAREDVPMKPDPRAFLIPLSQLGIPPQEACVVGDSHLDLIAASRANVAEVILVAPRDWMRPLFPEGTRFHEVPNLYAAKALLAKLVHHG
ncbi:TPA: hypothetical protein DCL37_03705 [Candidatus Acetothermia bacterium]|nr:HAD-IA family hydrolase [Candidatus Bipolaricaulota bacterium]HAF70446.1 hypothetical protein [Candidatus Acetothermia bacterium]